MESYPHPELDFGGFLAAVEKQNRVTSKVWDPVTKRPRSWIKKSVLRSMRTRNVTAGMCAIM